MTRRGIRRIGGFRREGTVSRRELDHIMVDKIMRAIKSDNDRSPSVIHFLEEQDRVTLVLEFDK